MARSAISEGGVVLTVGAVQFINILDFMMVMPLGPDFAKSLAIPVSHLGYVGGSYTAAASVSGVVGAFFLDRFDRRQALVASLVGLAVGTMLGGLATGMPSLLLARVVAGTFGGPATSLSYSIIADVIPPERRGKAMGAVMGAFSMASILGVPVSLELASLGSWRTPFFAVGGAGALVCALSFVVLPPMRGHLEGGPKEVIPLSALARADVVCSLAMTAVVMLATFVVVPNISAYVMGNLHYPRERLGLLYFVGGLVSFATMRIAGALVDKLGSAIVGTAGSLGMAFVIFIGFAEFPPWLPPIAIFVSFMTAASFRNVSYNTLTSKVPRPAERARFGSVQSSVQHLAGAVGAFVSSRILSETAAHELVHMDRVSWTSIVVSMALPPLLFVVERGVRRAKLAPAGAS
jgi:predicted MFS family arabinose efflux permease